MNLRVFDEVSQGRDNNFNLIRMGAAVAVLVSHAYPIALGTGAREPLEGATGFKLGEIAVMVFFAISGFLITKSFDRTRDWRRFLRARFWRLFPALAFVLVVTVTFAGLFLTTASSGVFIENAVAYVFRNLTLVKLKYQLPGVFVENPFGQTINGSLWTLFYEVACYAGVLILGLLGMLSNRFVATLVLIAFVVSNSLLTLLPWHYIVEKFISIGTPFAAGAWIYVWRKSIPLSLWMGLALAAAAYVAKGTMVYDAILSLAIAYAALAVGFTRVPPLLAYNRFGDFSYGTYVFAFPIQQLMAHYGATTPSLNMMLALPLVMVMAVISWHFVEAPALLHVHRKPQAEAGAT